MFKVKYTLLQKPTVSGWPSIPRQLKLGLALTVLSIVVITLLYRQSRITRLEKIIYVQDVLIEILDLEMDFINGDSFGIDDQWLAVDDLDGHVYSAYFDPRPEVIDQYSHSPGSQNIVWAEIRIISILPRDIDESQVDCIYRYRDDNGTFLSKRLQATSVQAIKDNWDLKYSAFFVICDLVVPKNLQYVTIHTEPLLPSIVTIVHQKTETVELKDSKRFVNVRYPNWRMSRPYENEEKFMAICVPVLHHNFDRPLDVVEFIEYYQLMGAGHFTFYNSSVSKDVNRVLQYYSANSAATVLSWKLPSKYIFERTLRYEGLFAGINDCLYRNSFNEYYDYVGNFGIDEFLVPKIHNDLSELMEYLDPMVDGSNQHASFLFRNVFFYTMYQDHYDNKDINVPYLYTHAKTRRVKEPQQAGTLSRYITRGTDSVELGNFRVSELSQGSLTHSGPFDEVVVDPEVALLHRYSPCEAEEAGCYLKGTVIDRTAHRFTKELGVKVATTCKNIFGKAGCPFVEKT